MCCSNPVRLPAFICTQSKRRLCNKCRPYKHLPLGPYDLKDLMVLEITMIDRVTDRDIWKTQENCSEEHQGFGATEY